MSEPGRRAPREGDEKTEASDERSGFGRKLLGLFVQEDRPAEPERSEAEPETAAAQVAAIARSTAPAPAAVIAAPPPSTVRPAAPGSYKPPDYAGIFKSGGLSEEERDRLLKAEELLRNLPAETPEGLKRQIVEGTLRTFGIPLEGLTRAAQKATDALETYLTIGAQDLKTRVETVEKRLAELRAEEAKLQQSLADRRLLQDTLTFDVRSRQAELRSVIAFLSQSAPPGAK